MLLLFSQESHGIEWHRSWRRIELGVRRREVILEMIDVELLEVAGEHGELLIEQGGNEKGYGIVGIRRRR